jgi:hypothetical protein
MEEHLLHFDSFIFYQSCNILHPHIFQPAYHKSNICTLLKTKLQRLLLISSPQNSNIIYVLT